MEIQKKRNRFPIGWKTEISEEIIFVDVINKISSNRYQKRKWLTAFGRELKIWDWVYTRDAKIEDKNNKVGFNK